MIRLLTLLTLLLSASSATAQQKVQTVEAKPLAKLVTPRLQPVQSGVQTLYLITWGGDVATIQAESEGLFKAEGLEVKLACENDFTKQAQSVLDGKTPYLRGTMGMICSAAEAFHQAGTELVVVYQMTWSTGGDTLTVRSGISSADDLRGKTIGLQWPGPHADLIANYLTNNNIKASDVRYRWFKELTLPAYDTKGAIIDPVSAFRVSKDLDGILCISPDAFALTSGGTTGTGAEDSVKGAHVVFSTRTASRIIADVYAVRKDWLDANRNKVQSFVRVLMRGEESLRDLRAGGATQQGKYAKLLERSAELLMGSPRATKDVEGMLADCEFVGSGGNLAFFTGQGTTRTLDTLVGEIQSAFIEMGLMTARAPVRAAGWDHATLTKGLKYADTAPASDPRFDAAKLQQGIEKQIAELESWEEGTLFVIEIGFQPNQSEFSENEYAAAYDKALKIAQTYGGALVTIEGHSDPLAISQARQKGELPAKIAEREQAAKNLSLQRAKKVQTSFLQFCKKRDVAVDASQFASVGLGISRPKFPNPATKEEWASNRRVVFRIKQVEAELEEFAPVK